MTKPATRRVVLDTNVLVSIFIFDDPRFSAMLAHIARGHWQAFTNDACLAEWRRVLARAMFGLDAAAQEAAYVRWRQLATPCDAVPGKAEPLPACRDPDDQKFLELACDAAADWLITDDKALLAVSRRQKLAGRFRILTPEAAMREA